MTHHLYTDVKIPMMVQLFNHILYVFSVCVGLFLMFPTAASLQNGTRITRFYRISKYALEEGGMDIICARQCARQAGCQAYSLLKDGECKLKMGPFDCKPNEICYIDAEHIGQGDVPVANSGSVQNATTISPNDITTPVEDTTKAVTTQSTSSSPIRAIDTTVLEETPTVLPTTVGKTTSIEKRTTILTTPVGKTTTIDETTTILPTTV